MMAVAAAQKNREMFAMKSSYSIEVSSLRFMSTKNETKFILQNSKIKKKFNLNQITA